MAIQMTEPTTPQVDVDAAMQDVANRSHTEVPGFESEGAILAAEVRRLRARVSKLESDLAADRETNETEAALDAQEKQKLRARIAELEADLLSWKGNCEQAWEAHGELSKELGQALDRNARLVNLGEAVYQRGDVILPTERAAWEAAKGDIK